jgi:glyoxylase-like metal-dependent hydrolase (beta-lactamase superfamily II)
VNTHWHGDHTGGNAHFGALAPILAHRNVRERLASRQQDLRGGTVEPAPPQALPVLTYEEGVTLHLNGEQIRILHLPGGHTDGDSVVLFSGSNVAHLGDLFFSGRFPVVDLRSGGSVAGMIRNVELLLEVLSEGVKIIPGHGPLSGIDDLRRFHRMLVETRDHVRRAMQEGRSLEQIQAAGLPSEWEPWGAGFISAASWIETIYRSEQTGG